MQVQKRAVAFLDILGFKNMLGDMPLSELAQKYEGIISNINLFNKPFSRGDELSLFTDHSENQRWCIVNVFSDSIILVSEDETEESCLKLLIYTWRLLQLTIASDMPVRGGISYGDFYINEKLNVFLGEALTNAYTLEGRQEWVGVAIDSKLSDTFPKIFNNKLYSSLLFPVYPVPLKGNTSKNLNVLNWRLNLVAKQGTRLLFKESNELSAKKKIENTLQFAKTIIDGGKVYVYGDDWPVELRTIYVGNSKPPFKHGDDL